MNEIDPAKHEEYVRKQTIQEALQRLYSDVAEHDLLDKEDLAEYAKEVYDIEVDE